MKVAVVTGPGTVELREQTPPALAPDSVAVAVAACGLCTMERRLFTGEKTIYPVAPGHEVAGHVTEIGAAVAGLPGAPAVGDLVAVDLWDRCGTCSSCRRGRSAVCKRPQSATLPDGTIAMGAGLSDHLQIAASRTYAMGDAPIAHAAMGEPVACVAHSVRLSGVAAGDRVAIIGAGYMGRLHLAIARTLGAGPIGVIDVAEGRLGEARARGAAWTATPDAAVATGGPQDIVFVTAGAPGALELALELADDGANVVLFGAFPKDLRVGVAPDALHHHEVSITGVLNQEPQDWRTASALIRQGTIADDLEALVTARFGLDDVAAALEHASSNPVYRVMVGTGVGS